MIATILLKTTLLLILAWTFTRLLRNRSAATRHFVWCAALAGCVAVAAVAYFAPPVEITVPRNVVLQPTLAPVTVAVPAGWKPAERPAGSRRSELPSLPTIWMIGVAATLGWSLLGHLALTRVARKAKETETIDGVSVRITDRISAPVTCGWSVPVILLPLESEGWPEERKRAALLHELAHIARKDFYVQTAARLAASLYWFHPLAWVAVARLRAESEHACDDRVLAGGMTAPDYAAHLLAVAHGALARRHGAVFGVAMARPSELENRLIAVLDETRSRGLLSRRTGVVAASLVALVLIPIAVANEKYEKKEKKETIHVGKKDDGPVKVVDHRIPAQPGETLTFDLPTGAGIDITGWDEPSVLVQVHFRGNDAENTMVAVGREGNGVRVRSEYQGSSQIQSSSLFLTVRAPRRINLEIDSAGGTLTFTDLEGNFHGVTGGGQMKLMKLKGRADITSGGGAITVMDSDLSGDVSTGGGRVTISHVTGGLRGSSGSGPVVYSDDDKKGDDQERDDAKLRVEQMGGAIELSEIPNGAELSTAGGAIDIGRAAGHIDAGTGGGDIRIASLDGSASLGTGAGDVTVTVENLKDVVDVRTGSGTVTVELPADVDARFELETAFTNTFRRETRIESDWNLEQRTSPTWDDAEGTPRRYVRARGTAGTGRGLIKVKAINGDVVIRRR